MASPIPTAMRCVDVADAGPSPAGRLRRADRDHGPSCLAARPSHQHGGEIPDVTTNHGQPLEIPGPDIGAFQARGSRTRGAAALRNPRCSMQRVHQPSRAPTVSANNSVEPVAGGVVTFAAPSGGASAGSQRHDRDHRARRGRLGVTALANDMGGSYTVAASTPGNAPDDRISASRI